MIKRLVPTLVALAVGLIFLGAGLVGLHGIFVREREDGRRALDERRSALEHYAKQAFAEALRARLEAAGPRIDRAAEDPLLPDYDLLLFRGTEQVLPRIGRPSINRFEPARTLLEALDRGGPIAAAKSLEVDDPVAERLHIAARFLDAVARKDVSRVEAAFRELLSHRARYRLSAAKDAALTLWVLERFYEQGQPDPSLMRALLRDGLTGGGGAFLEGLQRTLIARVSDFERADYGVLTRRVEALSEKTQVEYADFKLRVRGPAGPNFDPGRFRPEPKIDGPWYFQSDGRGGGRGIAVPFADVVEEVRTQMAARGLISANDALDIRVGGPVSETAVALGSPGIDAALAALSSRYALKAGLLSLTALMAMAIVALAALAQWRKLRFVELRSDFLATVSHELKTPLSAIRVMAETLERRVGGDKGAGDYPSRIVSEADGLTRLVENILTFNRLDKGRWEARQEDVALSSLVDAVVREAKELPGVALEVEADGLQDASLQGDPALLRILFSNLVHNALRYTARTPVRLQLSAVRTGGLQVRVRDNGVGIPKESWERVFEEFRRLSPDGVPAQGGSGLGLAICRRVMRLHGGDVRVAESSSEGTTFLLTFP